MVAQSGNVLLGQLNTETTEEFQVAIVQVSRITNRKGLQENLPQLAGAELGWAVDSQRLYIGNGTLQEGAPVVGNTEILTENSDIVVLSNYTYEDTVVGYAAQTGPTATDPVIRTLQAKLDDQASIRDFGAAGDGVTDDTAAINRALYQLYCRENNSEIRRSLFFPAGTYLVTDTIVIPTYAKLVGEGANHSTIYMSGGSASVLAQYGDSRQQTGVNIGTNGATAPRNIEISSMTFQSDDDISLFLVDRAQQCWFHSVNFVGSITSTRLENADVTPLPDIAAVGFESTPTLVTQDITFDCCSFENITYGIATGAEIMGITVSNSNFNYLYQGIVLGVDSGTGPTGFRAVHNMFNNIYAEAIDYGEAGLNVSAYNVFYNVGYNISTGTPLSPVISFGNDNNVSVNDLFERSDGDAYIMPRVRILSSAVTSGGVQSQMGRLFQSTGQTFTLQDNRSSYLPIFYVNNDDVKAFQMFYTITRGPAVRNGVMTVVSGPADSVGDLATSDDYTENTFTGVVLHVTQSGSQVQMQYSSSSTGLSGTLTYSITHLA